MPSTEDRQRSEWISEYLKLHERNPAHALHWVLVRMFERVTATERTMLLDELEDQVDLLERERG